MITANSGIYPHLKTKWGLC